MHNVKKIAQTTRTTTNAADRGFTSRNLTDSPNFTINPFLVLGDFHMPQPFFPPHPHAGFSVTTYLFEDSPGAVINRDSFGDHSRIEPGGWHWTQAGRGIQHEENPERPGVDTHGLQVWVNLAAAHKDAAPTRYHARAQDVPELRQDDARLRVIAGRYGQLTAGFDTLTDAHLYDAQLGPSATLNVAIPDGHTSFAWVIQGTGRFGDGPAGHLDVTSGDAVTFDMQGERVVLHAGPSGMGVILGTGTPLPDPVVYGGPFVMNTPEQLLEARRRYQRGEMGYLAPSADVDETTLA